MRRSIRITVILAIAFLAVGAAPAAAQGNESRHFAEDSIDRIFTQFRSPSTPGCAVGVYRAGKVEFAKGYGTANLEHAIPINPDTVFDIASNSKQFTAFAVLLLESRGRLSLDDRVTKYVPELSKLEAPIKIRHLVHNTSGLWGIGDVLEFTGHGIERHFNRAQFFDLLETWGGLSFPPGDRYQYSNTNWILLGLVIERVDGRPIARILKEEVFEPLGMRNTLVRDDPSIIVPGRVSNYTPQSDGTYRINTAWGLTEGIGGMAFMHTTVRDLARWDANFYSAKVGGKDVVRRMYEVGVLNGGEPIHYAGGLKIGTYRGLRFVYHGGLGGGTSEIARFPDEGLTVSVLCNQYYTHTDSWSFALEVAEVYLSARMQEQTKFKCSERSATEEIRRFEGLYWNEDQFRSSRFEVRDGCLFELSEGDEAPMAFLGNGVFQDDFETISFDADAAGGYGDHRPTREKYRLVRLDENFQPENLRSFEGAFYSSDLRQEISFEVRDGKLHLIRRLTKPTVLVPQRKDTFRFPGGLLKFVRGSESGIEQVELHTPRVTGLKFFPVK